MESTIKNYIVSIALAIMTTIAILSDVRKEGFYNAISVDALVLFLVAVFFTFFYYKSIGTILKRFHGGILIGAIVFATLNMMGKCLYFSDSLEFLKTGLLPVIMYIGFAVLFYIIVADLYQWLDTHSNRQLFVQKNENNSKIWGILHKRPFLYSFIFIFLCWLPWLIVFYPGCIGWDLFVQLDEAAGIYPLTNHHPVLTTWFAYACVKFGNFLWCDNLGIFIYFVLRALICAACYGYCVSQFVIWKICKPVVYCVLLFYGPNFIFAVYSVTQHKDTWFTAFISLTIVTFITLAKEKTKPHKNSEYLLLLVSIVLTCLTRHNGLYVILPACILLALFILKDRKSHVTMILAFVMIFSFIKIILPLAGVEESDSREAFSIPFQQTARCVRDCKMEITEDEKAAINKVLDFETLAERYNPMLSDAVKGSYGEGFLTAGKKEQTERMLSYFKVWWKMLWKHPIKYIEATISNSSGYYAFVPKTTIEQLKGNTNAGMAFCLYISTSTAIDTKTFSFKYPAWSGRLREKFISLANNFEKVPLVGVLYSCAIYTWLLFIMIGYLFHNHKWKELILFVPSFLSICVCIASPVDDSFRYFLPVVGMMPMCLLYFDMTRE